MEKKDSLDEQDSMGTKALLSLVEFKKGFMTSQTITICVLMRIVEALVLCQKRGKLGCSMVA